MRTCDVLIVGGGPGGSTCARALTRAGADVVVIDRARFPRDKVCAGWVTPAAFAALQLDPRAYRASGHILQDLRGFDTRVIGGSAVTTNFGRVVSYAIRRCEFDWFLLQRSGARILQDTPLETLERSGDRWTINGEWQAPVLVGAGGHFCPVAQRLRPRATHGVVIAREIELPLPAPERCRISGEIPELFFSRDLDGYGWCVRKGDYLNIGLGRRSRTRFDVHVREFATWLTETGRLPDELEWRRWRGHAYLLAGANPHPPIGDGVVLVGDAAGLAAPESGEGIGPAIQSGVLAAQAILGAGGRFTRDGLQPYADALRTMCPTDSLARRLRARAPAALGRLCLASPRFTRRVLEQWFLRAPATTPDAWHEAA
jgi:flavin-dependent dehydrogenase